MSFFDDPQQNKKQNRERIKQQVQNRRNRNRKDKVNKGDQKKPQRVYPPMMIWAKQNQEGSEQPLEDYINWLFQTRQSHKDSRKIQSFKQEDDEGHIEYKLKLVGPSDDRLDHLATQMKFRIKQGLGDAHYKIGLQDNGRPTGLQRQQMLESMRTICLLATRVGADVMVLRVTQGIKGLVLQLVIRKIQKQGIKLQVRVLLFGQSGSGKSTLLGVLLSGEKDDGKGAARVKVFTHPLQIMTGITQQRSHHVVGFDSKGKPIGQQNYMSIQKWLDNSNKLLTFIDVGGHKKAKKQIVSSLCSFFPQYALHIVSGLGKSSIDTDTVQLVKTFGLPLIVVMTRLDQMTKDVQMQAVLRLKQQLKKHLPQKTPCVVKEMQHAVLFSRITSTEDVLPIFLISSVTGQNLDLLTSFLHLLTASSQLKNNQDMSPQFSISDKYVVQGNIILAGTVVRGSIKRGQLLHIGPDQKGSFRTVQVMSIQCLRVPVKLAKCGQVCTVAIRPLNYAKQWLQKQPHAIRRGMVLIDAKSNPKAVYQFLVELIPYSNEKSEFSVTQKYQPVINTLTSRQTCSIVMMKAQKQIEQMPTMQKKKSKSIDSRKQHLSQNMHSSLIMSKNKSIKIFSKKSCDLTNQINQQKPSQLQSIAQELPKKNKQIRQIKFQSGKPTYLRLRFRFNPQYVTIGQKVIIYELKLAGRVKQIYY